LLACTDGSHSFSQVNCSFLFFFSFHCCTVKLIVVLFVLLPFLWFYSPCILCFFHPTSVTSPNLYYSRTLVHNMLLLFCLPVKAKSQILVASQQLLPTGQLLTLFFFSFNVHTGGLIVVLLCYATLVFVLVTQHYLFLFLSFFGSGDLLGSCFFSSG